MNEDPYLYEPHPLNAPGPFYVMNDSCIACEAPEREAPDLMSHEGTPRRGSYSCYFKRQPKTPEELERAISAVIVACCGAVRYKGRDPEVLKRLTEHRPNECDASPEAIAERLTQHIEVRPPGYSPDRSHPMYDHELDL